eukprot:2478695-Lingulodinium_polyedra.AAC.1
MASLIALGPLALTASCLYLCSVGCVGAVSRCSVSGCVTGRVPYVVCCFRSFSVVCVVCVGSGGAFVPR